MKLTCQICGQYWDVEDGPYREKTPICIVCKVKRRLVSQEDLINIVTEYQKLKGLLE